MKRFENTIWLVIAFLCFMNVAHAQQKTIRGRVVDASDGLPIIGANIIEYDKDDRIIFGTTTNINGDFALQMVDIGNTIKISFIGYITQEIKPQAQTEFSIKLEPSSVELEEVVIRSEAKTDNRLMNIDERDNASSTVKIDLMDMRDAGVLSASDALQGKVTGLDIISASGDPGSGSQLVIRGLSSMSNSKPLIVIDGIPQMDLNIQDFDFGSADQEDIGNLINIAVQDIKSIEVLKDAAATAQYGSRGADGVLLIETHKGKMGRVQVEYQYKHSYNFQPPPIPMLNGNEYVMLQLEEWHNNYGIFEIPPEIAYDRDNYDFYNYAQNTDWIGSVTQDAATKDHYLKISGGGEKARYFTSFSYLDEGGTTISTGAKRFSTRVNLDYLFSRKFSFSILFNYVNNRKDGNLEWEKAKDDPTYDVKKNRNIREMAYIKSPNMSIWEYDAFGNLTGEYFNPINSYQGSGSNYFNPIAVANLGMNDDNSNSLENSFRVKYDILSWLTIRETVSFQFSGNKSEAFLPYSAIGSDWLGYNVNIATEGNNNSSSFRTETQLSFDSPFSNEIHSVTGAFTWITNRSGYEWMSIQSNRTPSTDIKDPSVNAQIGWIGNGSGEARELGGLANVNYKYRDKYLVQTVLRADAHSSFGANNRWGLFKAVALGWRFSSEPFMQALQFLGESKITASWGVSGRQPGDAYARFATYKASGNYINKSVVTPEQIQLDNLRWETMTSYNLGAELNLFQDRLYVKTEFYIKTTEDLLFKDYEIPIASGYDKLKWYNGGELENKGWELLLNSKIIKKANFSLSVDFNTSRNINTFTRLPGNFNNERSTSIGNGQYPLRVIEGEPIGSFFGFRYLGVWASDKDVVAKDADGNVILDADGVPIPFTYLGTYNFKGGDPIYADLNNDGKIDLNDVDYIGDSNPDFVGGFGTNISMWNFDLGFGFHYRIGYDIINMVALETQGMNNRNNQSKAVLRRWRAQGQDQPDILPRAYLNHPANNLGSDRYVEDGSFLRLINLKFGYRFRQEWCRAINVNSMNIAVTARKLWTLTQYTGQDPEVGQDASDPFWIGVDEANTPPPRIVTFSISVGL
jgi:TonB-linked SusC/RagA family outer membrane protein